MLTGWPALSASVVSHKQLELFFLPYEGALMACIPVVRVLKPHLRRVSFSTSDSTVAVRTQIIPGNYKTLH